MIWLPWVTHRTVYHKMAVWTVPRSVAVQIIVCVGQGNQGMRNSSIASAAQIVREDYRVKIKILQAKKLGSEHNRTKWLSSS